MARCMLVIHHTARISKGLMTEALISSGTEPAPELHEQSREEVPEYNL
jgi:hypothetical protein